MTALGVDGTRCASCGARPAVIEADLRIASENRDVSAEDALVRACARHLMLDCPNRYMGHEALGAEARWNRYEHPNGQVTLEVAWTVGTWGMPFVLYKVPGFKPGLVGRADWRLD